MTPCILFEGDQPRDRDQWDSNFRASRNCYHVVDRDQRALMVPTEMESFTGVRSLT